MAAKRILVVDDDASVRWVIKQVLGSAGFLVTEATDGPEALRQVAQGSPPFDVVFLDQKLPGMSGEETFAHLRELVPASRIVVLSGCLLPEPETSATLGVQHFLPKPFASEELLRAVRDALAE